MTTKEKVIVTLFLAMLAAYGVASYLGYLEPTVTPVESPVVTGTAPSSHVYLKVGPNEPKPTIVVPCPKNKDCKG